MLKLHHKLFSLLQRLDAPAGRRPLHGLQRLLCLAPSEFQTTLEHRQAGARVFGIIAVLLHMLQGYLQLPNGSLHIVHRFAVVCGLTGAYRVTTQRNITSESRTSALRWPVSHEVPCLVGDDRNNRTRC